jgi:hypothetical protein
MSSATSPPHANPFVERLILFLMPYFLPVAVDPAVARAEILETLGSYGGRTRAEVINAARIIAFSFSALDTLAEATAEDLSASMRLRYKGCANNLNRSCQQNEQNLAMRLACDLPEAIEQSTELVNDVPDHEYQKAVQHAHDEIAAHRDRLDAARSPNLPSRRASTTQQAENDRIWGSVMMEVLSEMGMPVQPAAP